MESASTRLEQTPVDGSRRACHAQMARDDLLCPCSRYWPRNLGTSDKIAPMQHSATVRFDANFSAERKSSWLQPPQVRCPSFSSTVVLWTALAGKASTRF